MKSGVRIIYQKKKSGVRRCCENYFIFLIHSITSSFSFSYFICFGDEQAAEKRKWHAKHQSSCGSWRNASCSLQVDLVAVLPLIEVPRQASGTWSRLMSSIDYQTISCTTFQFPDHSQLSWNNIIPGNNSRPACHMHYQFLIYWIQIQTFFLL